MRFMPQHFIRQLTGKHRTRKSDTQLGMILAFIAGAVNAGGFLAVGYYTSHMSGIASSIADFLVLHQLQAAVAAVLFLAAFIAGAITSCMIITIARAHEPSSEFALALMLEAFLLLIFGISATPAIGGEWLSPNGIIALLCFIMGLQNAIITKISHAEIRTTHVTGVVTDMGIEMGRWIVGLFGGTARFHAERLRLHAGLLAAFVTGAIVGAYSFQHYGFIMVWPLACLLAVLASVPIVDDFRPKKTS
jgi:uncharacterized membrane protein YoaK (UPF0700 family)